jgi:8-oxo-dGTP pyrophosphatase MutT (NUDIX family)
MAHIHEKVDFTVEVFIVYKNKVLLRMHDKYNVWCSVGGHIELDEDPIQAAYREVKEEVGLDIELVGKSVPDLGEEKFKIMMPPQYLGRHRVNETHEHVVHVYFAKSNTDVISDSVLEHEKGSEIKWATMEDLQTMDLVPNIKFYAEQALKELGE